MTLSWYVVQSKASQEIRAWISVADLRFETFFPQERRIVVHAGKREAVLRAFYPSYLFARFDLDADAWGAILRSPGVSTIVGMQRVSSWHQSPGLATHIGRPRVLKDDAMERMREWVAEETRKAQLIGTGKAPTNLTGFSVRVRVGDRELDALVQADVGKRVLVLLDMLGKGVPTTVSRDSVAWGDGGGKTQPPVVAGRLRKQ